MEIKHSGLAKDSYIPDVNELLQHLKTISFNTKVINYFEPAYPQNALNAECYIYVRMYETEHKHKLKSIISILGGKIYDIYDNESFWFSL